METVAPLIWKRAADGYRLTSPHEPGWESHGEIMHGPIITAKTPATAPIQFEVPDRAFLKFADAIESPAALLSLVDRFGLLSRDLVTHPGDKSGPRVGERFVIWQMGTSELAQAVRLWNAIRDARPHGRGALERHVRKIGDVIIYDSHPDLPIGPRFAGIAGIPPQTDENPATTEPRIVGLIATAATNPDWFKTLPFDASSRPKPGSTTRLPQTSTARPRRYCHAHPTGRPHFNSAARRSSPIYGCNSHTMSPATRPFAGVPPAQSG